MNMIVKCEITIWIVCNVRSRADRNRRAHIKMQLLFVALFAVC